MSEHVCLNPDCKKTYNLNDKDADTEFCSFECWEAINCKFPKLVTFEEFSLE